jgi:AbrB family looped-hinge helix DNA binding protein
LIERRKSTAESRRSAVPEAVKEAPPEAVVVVASDGRITLPLGVREALGLKTGDQVVIALDRATARQAILRLPTPLERIRAEAKRRGKPLDLDEARRRFEEEWPREELRAPLAAQGENG